MCRGITATAPRRGEAISKVGVDEMMGIWDVGHTRNLLFIIIILPIHHSQNPEAGHFRTFV